MLVHLLQADAQVMCTGGDVNKIKVKREREKETLRRMSMKRIIWFWYSIIAYFSSLESVL